MIYTPNEGTGLNLNQIISPFAALCCFFFSATHRIVGGSSWCGCDTDTVDNQWCWSGRNLGGTHHTWVHTLLFCTHTSLSCEIERREKKNKSNRAQNTVAESISCKVTDLKRAFAFRHVVRMAGAENVPVIPHLFSRRFAYSSLCFVTLCSKYAGGGAVPLAYISELMSVSELMLFFHSTFCSAMSLTKKKKKSVHPNDQLRGKLRPFYSPYLDISSGTQ